MPENQNSDALLQLFIKAEGLSTKAYRCPANILTIGIGHANQVTAKFDENSEWTEEECIRVWHLDMEHSRTLAEKYLKGTYAPPEFIDAVTDIVFNTGQVPRTLISRLRNKDHDGAADAVLDWIYAGGVVLPGLIKRRIAMFAYIKKDPHWLDVMDLKLSSKQFDNPEDDKDLIAFNEAIKHLGLRIEKTSGRLGMKIIRENKGG